MSWMIFLKKIKMWYGLSEFDIPEEEFQRIRKRILDYGNDTIIEIDENLDNFEIKLKL